MNGVGFGRLVRWGVGALGLGALVVGIGACEVATPFRGPGVAGERGGLSPDDRVVVALTHAQLGWQERGVFFEYSARVIEDLARHDGFVAYSLRRNIAGTEVWTATIWRDHESADAFVKATEHREAMREGMRAIRRGRFHRVEWAASELPLKWSDLKREIGRVELVDYTAKRPRDQAESETAGRR